MSTASNGSTRTLWLYCVSIFAFWVVTPELRRILDWRQGFHASQILTVVPFLGMAVFILAIMARPNALPRRAAVLAWLWCGSFVYAGVVGWLSGQGLSAIYDFVQFVAPMFIGLWIASSSESMGDAFKRMSTAILAIAAVVSVYGIIQFVVLPRWDAVWMIQVARFSGMSTNGLPFPFQVRVFSVLTSPAPCATFLAVAIALNLNRLREPRALPRIALFLCAIALALTLVRSAWIALAAALLAYLFFTPNSKKALAIVFAFSIAMPVFFWLVTPLIPQTGRDVVFERVRTFTDLGKDTSVNARAVSTQDLLQQGVSEPLGQGLGIIGTSTQLTSMRHSIVSIDGGYQARFAEMGFFGFAGYVAALLLAFGGALAIWRNAKHTKNDTLCEMAAAVLAAQAVLLVMDFSFDAHVNVLGALFWIIAGIGLAHAHADEHESGRAAAAHAKTASSIPRLAT